MTDSPIKFRWNGEAMEPLQCYFTKECDKRFIVGQVYVLTEHLDRSGKSHKHQFAEVKEAWRNLPLHLSNIYPTAEHLRKLALIATGYSHVEQFIADTPAGAERFAQFYRGKDDFCVVTVASNVANIFTAKSQSYRSMGKKEFQESKTAVLEYCAALIGVSSDELRQNAGKAA